jgi:mRNA-degrading endonuclease RelE of RelBE toxin-antitoxin system
MGYTVQLSNAAIKDLKKIDKLQSKIIIAWIEKN